MNSRPTAVEPWTDRSPYVGYSSESRLSVGHLTVGPGSISGLWASLLEPIPHGGMHVQA